MHSRQVGGLRSCEQRTINYKRNVKNTQQHEKLTYNKIFREIRDVNCTICRKFECRAFHDSIGGSGYYSSFLNMIINALWVNCKTSIAVPN